MAKWYVPSTEEIKAQATMLGGWSPEAFDLWLAAHDAEVRTQALRDAADEVEMWREQSWNGSTRAVPNMRRAAWWLRLRAARMNAGKEGQS